MGITVTKPVQFTPGALTITQAMDYWGPGRYPVYCDDKLALNVVVYDFASLSIRLSFATWMRLQRHPALREQAMTFVGEPGVHHLSDLDPIPGHHVGNLYRQSMAVLNATSAGEPDHAAILRLREEIAVLRGLLDEAEATLDTCAIVEAVTR
jgi:hypothetical protein